VRILVTGASGLVGGRLAWILSRRFEVVAAHHTSPAPTGLPRARLDLESPASVESALDEARPDAVVHAGAFAFVDLCERDPDRAARVNTQGSEAMARACAARGLRLVAISTDLVFAGDHAYSDEQHPPAPLTTYGRTKLQGEEAVLALCPRGVVARIPLMLGRGYGTRGTATESITWALRAGRPLTLFTDQYRTPVDAQSVASALDVLLGSDHGGRFHLGGPQRLSRYELGLRVAAVHGLPSEGIIQAVPQEAIPAPAPRPPDVSLDSGRARRELGYEPRPLDEMIRGDRPGPDAA
jgi:dTDP-4-dehydrorhamnose reductase